jgi:hypothetical protein
MPDPLLSPPSARVDGQAILEELCDVRAALARMQGGACSVEAVGAAGVWTARVGLPGADRHVVITAGLHAAELLGVAAALACVRAAREARLERVCFHVLPAADSVHVEHNAREVLRAGHPAALLELDSPRDLEHALWATAPEAEAARTWLQSIGSVDAYLSFHTASCLSGGAFFYLQGEGALPAALLASLRAQAASLDIPLLDRDPTPVPSHLREPGFFALQDLGQGALAHVHERFAPEVSLVSEIPVGFVPAGGSAEQYMQLSRRYAQGRAPAVPVRLLPAEDHVRCLVSAALVLGHASESGP